MKEKEFMEVLYVLNGYLKYIDTVDLPDLALHWTSSSGQRDSDSKQFISCLPVLFYYKGDKEMLRVHFNLLPLTHKQTQTHSWCKYLKCWWRNARFFYVFKKV